jgi:16S rRNA (guanine1516-N2)-methyltransferase
LHWALAQNVARVVVKRPLRAEPLGGTGPSHSLSGKAVRFDVYSRRRL